MAKPHWTHSTYDPDSGEPPTQRHGCQHSTCDRPAEWQWQRAATEAEIDAENNTQGPYGSVHRNTQGPHHVSVFACNNHIPKTPDGLPDQDAMATKHHHTCPAPDEGCDCA